MTVMLLKVMLFVGVDGPGVDVDVNFDLMCGIFVGGGVAGGGIVRCVGCGGVAVPANQEVGAVADTLIIVAVVPCFFCRLMLLALVMLHVGDG
jgi:hypothetical protein